MSHYTREIMFHRLHKFTPLLDIMQVGYRGQSRPGSAMTGEITVNSTGQLNYIVVDITENLDPGYIYNISVHSVSNGVAGEARTTEQSTGKSMLSSYCLKAEIKVLLYYNVL